MVKINLGHGKLRKVMEKVMESHGISKTQKSMNPEGSKEPASEQMEGYIRMRTYFVCNSPRGFSVTNGWLQKGRSTSEWAISRNIIFLRVCMYPSERSSKFI